MNTVNAFFAISSKGLVSPVICRSEYEYTCAKPGHQMSFDDFMESCVRQSKRSSDVYYEIVTFASEKLAVELNMKFEADKFICPKAE